MEIQGPVGALEIQQNDAPQPEPVTAILCHPHPQYGGNMHDAVLQTCTERLLEQGINCVRFNCRGVGASNGAYDKGFGESEDLLAIADWVSLHRLTHQQFWLGYSFGAAVVWRALQALRNAPPAKAILLAPPTGMLEFNHQPASTQVTAIAGDQDNFVDLERLKSMHGITVTELTGSDHFFSGQHIHLSHALSAVCGNAGDRA